MQQAVCHRHRGDCTSNPAPAVAANVLQAAATYLAMVASGSLLYLIITAAGIKATTVDCCSSLILCSWIGPAAHLLLLWLLPPAAYLRHRAIITLGFRLFYLAATSVNGFAVCGVGPIGLSTASNSSSVQLESPMSAFLWRSGVIGLIWYAGAFPLLFWPHLLVQSGFLLTYWRTLSPAVCSTIQRIQYGPESIAATTSAAQMLWAQLLAAHGAPHAAEAVLQAALQQHGTAGASHSNCMQGLGLLQVVVGHALPTFLLYCVEARNRHHWLAVQRQQQRRRRPRSSSNASSSSSSSGEQLGVSGSWPDLLCSLDPAADAAAAAAAGLEQQQQQQPAAAGCSSKAAGPQHAANASAAATEGLSAAAAAASEGLSAVAAAAGRRAPSRRSSWRGLLGSCSSSTDEDESQQLLLDLPAVDVFDVESSGGCLPPNFPEVYVLLLAVGLGWFGLEAMLGGA